MSSAEIIDPGIGKKTFTVRYRVVGRSLDEQLIDLANRSEADLAKDHAVLLAQYKRK